MREWFHLIEEGATITHNPWGTPLFGAVFFGITGLHMTHVMIGVIYLGIVATGYGRGKFSAEDVEVNGLYWHFVDLVWMFVFPLIYLMSVKYYRIHSGRRTHDEHGSARRRSPCGASIGPNLAVWIGLVGITCLEVFLAYEQLQPTVMLTILVSCRWSRPR